MAPMDSPIKHLKAGEVQAPLRLDSEEFVCCVFAPNFTEHTRCAAEKHEQQPAQFLPPVVDGYNGLESKKTALAVQESELTRFLFNYLASDG